MGFLDNSGDIILDAVLTDTGRMRLAKGDGTFRIAKFALGDDEINYESYNKNHPSGSAYFDLEVLQTPVFEAFTNNTSNLKSKLISIARTNLLYLPVLKMDNQTQNTKPESINSFNLHLVAVDEETEDALGLTKIGLLAGVTLASSDNFIRVDQGLDTDEISYSFTIDADLYESQYILEIDNRLGQIVTKQGGITRVSFIDDDNIASYYFSQGTDTALISSIGQSSEQDSQVIDGPRGSRIEFKIKSSIELTTSNFLFTQLGGRVDVTGASPGTGLTNAYYIDSTVRVTGATTGYRIDIPIRFIKKA